MAMGTNKIVGMAIGNDKVWPTFDQTETLYDFTADDGGFTFNFGQEFGVGTTDGLSIPFPTSWNVPFTGAAHVLGTYWSELRSLSWSGAVSRPRGTGNKRLYTEGSSAGTTTKPYAINHYILFPRSYNRDNGLGIEAWCEISSDHRFDGRWELFYRPVGGGDQDWQLAVENPQRVIANHEPETDGYINSWTYWSEPNALPAGEPVELMLAARSHGAIPASATDGAIVACDMSVDDIKIIETIRT